jgi:hypothetical protein
MAFFIINRTRRKAKRPKEECYREWPNNTWPLSPAELEGFAEPGDTLELAEIDTKNHTYGGIAHIRQSPYTYGATRIHPDGTRFCTSKENAENYLQEMRQPTGTELPIPRCEKCADKAEKIPELQSIADTGKCYKCRAPKMDVVLPRPKKKKK